MNSPLREFVGIDMSYSDTGICFLSEEEGGSNYISAKSIKSGHGIGSSFLEYMGAAKHMDNLFLIICSEIKNRPDAAVAIEVPAYSQSAKAALAIGMCWQVAIRLESNFPDRVAIIDPGILKHWSESKKGDGKSKVKEKVLSRTYLEGWMKSNDNIVDAIGICMALSDLRKLRNYQ